MTLRERAATALGVPADAPPSAVRSSFLTRLTEEGFLPPPESTWAARTLGESNLPLTADAKEEAASAEREAVEAFANDYWSLAPISRISRHRELVRQVNDAAASARLNALHAGLEVETKRQDNALVEEVAATIRRLYVLPARECTLERCRWLAENASRRSDLRDAARRLRADEPQMGRLLPAFHNELARKDAFVPMPEIDRAFAEAEREEWARKRMAQAEAAVQEQYRTEYRPARTESGCGGWSGYIVVLILVFAARACYSTSRNTETNTQPTINWNNQWNKKFEPLPLPSRTRFTAAEIEEFQRYERVKDFVHAPALPIPRHYSLWILAGRPTTPAPTVPGAE